MQAWQVALTISTAAFIRPLFIFSLCKRKPRFTGAWRDVKWWGLWREVFVLSVGCFPYIGEMREKGALWPPSQDRQRAKALEELLGVLDTIFLWGWMGTRLTLKESPVKMLWLNKEDCNRSKLCFHWRWDQEPVSSGPDHSLEAGASHETFRGRPWICQMVRIF